MPKLKSKRSAVKRFRATGTGKIKAQHTHKRHNLTLGRTRKGKRQLKGNFTLAPVDEKHIYKALPYGLPK